uniref:Uncharacterized protein n=1 Tax=Panagrolaimus sp. JU765 TaxID=591449 RepID=A0AC34PZY1_9BILA
MSVSTFFFLVKHNDNSLEIVSSNDGKIMDGVDVSILSVGDRLDFYDYDAEILDFGSRQEMEISLQNNLMPSASVTPQTHRSVSVRRRSQSARRFYQPRMIAAERPQPISILTMEEIDKHLLEVIKSKKGPLYEAMKNAFTPPAPQRNRDGPITPLTVKMEDGSLVPLAAVDINKLKILLTNARKTIRWPKPTLIDLDLVEDLSGNKLLASFRNRPVQFFQSIIYWLIDEEAFRRSYLPSLALEAKRAGKRKATKRYVTQDFINAFCYMLLYFGGAVLDDASQQSLFVDARNKYNDQVGRYKSNEVPKTRNLFPPYQDPAEGAKAPFNIVNGIVKIEGDLSSSDETPDDETNE